MFSSLLKFDSKLTLNKTEQSLSVNEAKSAPLTLFNQNSFNFFKSNNALNIFTRNYILFQEWKKKVKYLKYLNIFKSL